MVVVGRARAAGAPAHISGARERALSVLSFLSMERVIFARQPLPLFLLGGAERRLCRFIAGAAIENCIFQVFLVF